MKRAALLAIGCLSASVALSGPRCPSSDSWRGPDKTKHFVVGGLASLAATGVTGNPVQGWAMTTGVALAWELAPLVTKRGGCSLKDFLVGSAGAAVGATVGGLSLRYGGGEYQVAYHLKF